MREETSKVSSKDLVNFFRRIGFPRRYHDANDTFEIQEFDLTPIKLDVGYFTPFFFPRKNLSGIPYLPHDTVLDFLDDAKQYLQKHQRKFGVLVLNNRVKDLDDLVREFEDARIALCTGQELEELWDEDDKVVYDKFGLILTKFLGRDPLSPYVYGRPAIGGRFFSRSKIVKELSIAKNHYIALGIRRIGKTSLLRELAGRLKREQGYKIIEIYGGKCNTTEDVLYELYVEMDLKTQARELEQARNIYLTTNAVNDFKRHILNEVKKEKQFFAFFIDEFDHVLGFDEKKNNNLSHIFREMATTDDNCRFFFAGFRKTKKAIEDIDHPLYNFGQVKDLEPFTKTETFEMLSVPLTRMGIEISENVKETIYSQTGGLPELIQIYAAHIVRFYDVKKVLPTSEELLREVANSDDFKHKIEASFLVNANPHEQLLCYLAIQQASIEGRTDQIEFTKEQIEPMYSAKVKNTVYEMKTMLDNLIASAIIDKATGTTTTYKFRVPLLVKHIRNMDLEYEINNILGKIEGYSPFQDTVEFPKK